MTNTSAPSNDRVSGSSFSVRLIEMIRSEVSLEPDEPIEPDTDLLLTGLVDSLGVVVIVQWMEQELGLTIPPADVILDNFQTVAQMVEYAEGRAA